MTFIEEFSEIEALLLPDSDDEDAGTSAYKDEEIDRLPVIAHEVAEYENEIDDSPHHSWRSERSLLVAEVPDRADCYALLELDWDDNWGTWTWSCEAVVEGAPSRKAAATAMLERYARERLSNSGGGAYQAFLESLLPPPETVEPNELVSKLIQEAQGLIDAEESSGGDDFPVETELRENEQVVWVASTFDGFALVNVFEVRCASQPTQFVALSHSDGGVVFRYDGPWASLEDAQRSFATEEGWTIVK
ncbi:hypothetical protein [Marivivens marinus]|uniref:hypothetical protein n=1 Tax=Marivivens marinus TaxID=3110173 RepID=UPI003B849BCC